MSAYPELALFWSTQAQVDNVYLAVFAGALALVIAGLMIQPHWSVLKARLSRISYPLIWVVMSIAIAVRLPGLFESLWYDETFTAKLASLSLPDLWTVIQADVHPPLWYLISWVSSRLIGDSEFALRTPALLCGLGVVYLMYRIADYALLGKDRAAIAALFAALLPAGIYYSNEARGYALLTCGVLAMILAIIEHRPRLFLIAAVITMYTHNLGFMYAALLGLYTFYNRPSWWRWIIPAGAIGALWLPFLLRQSADISDGFWIPPITLGTITRPLLEMTLGGRLPGELAVFAGVSLLAVTMWAMWHMRNSIPFQVTRPAIIAGLAVPLVVAAVSVIHNVYLSRALLPAVTLLCIVWGWIAVQPATRRWLPFVGAPLLLALAFSWLPTYARWNFRELLPAACQGTDHTYTTTVSTAFISSYYLSNVTVWPDANDLNQTLSTAAQDVLWERKDFGDLSGTICIIETETPLNRADEQDYLNSILARHMHQTILLGENDTFAIKVHIVEVG
jgi:uncharacterized membrane protein